MSKLLRIILLFFSTLLFGQSVFASTDIALSCKRNYQRGMDYYMFFKIGNTAALASKSGFPVMDANQGILAWEDLRLQDSNKESKNWYLTIRQYPIKSNYGDRREWSMEYGPMKTPKIYLRLSLPNAKDYDDRVVIYDIACETMDNPKKLFEQVKVLYQRDLEAKKYQFDVYPNFGFQQGASGGFNNRR